MDKQLSGRLWLVGRETSLADIAYLPYIIRLEHLSLEVLWADLPNLSEWYARIRQTRGYEHGISSKFDGQKIDKMQTRSKAKLSDMTKMLLVAVNE